MNSTAASLSQIAANKAGPGSRSRKTALGTAAQIGASPTRYPPTCRERHRRTPKSFARRFAAGSATRAHHPRDNSGRAEAAMANPGRQRASSGAAKGRSRQYRRAAPIRDRGLGGSAERDRTRRAALRGRENGGARVCRGRSLCDCRDRAAAGRNAAPGPRRAVDPDPIAGRRHRDVGIGRRTRHPAQLCQYHRSAFAARGRRRLQDLLHARLAQRPDSAGAIDPNPGRDFQRDDNGNRLWQPVDVRRSRHVEHGRADGAGASFDNGGGGAVPAGADGAAAQGRARLGWQPAAAARAGDRGAARGAPGRTSFGRRLPTHRVEEPAEHEFEK